MTEQVNNFESPAVWLLDQPTSQGEFFNTAYLSPSSSVSSDTSQYSDYSLASPSYTININLADIESQVGNIARKEILVYTQSLHFQIFNIPEGFYPPEMSDDGAHLQELSLASSSVFREESEAASDNDDCDSVKNNFDIETLVDECFMSQYSGMQVSVQS